MNTMNGVSPEISVPANGYNDQMGIALLSSDGDSFVGDSQNEGSVYQTARIYWRITRLSDGVFEGGITGDDWYSTNPLSPFHDERWDTPQEIWNQAVSEGGTLNEVFMAWNASTEVNDRILFLASLIGTEADTNNCYAILAG